MYELLHPLVGPQAAALIIGLLVGPAGVARNIARIGHGRMHLVKPAIERLRSDAQGLSQKQQASAILHLHNSLQIAPMRSLGLSLGALALLYLAYRDLRPVEATLQHGWDPMVLGGLLALLGGARAAAAYAAVPPPDLLWPRIGLQAALWGYLAINLTGLLALTSLGFLVGNLLTTALTYKWVRARWNQAQISSEALDAAVEAALAAQQSASEGPAS